MRWRFHELSGKKRRPAAGPHPTVPSHAAPVRAVDLATRDEVAMLEAGLATRG